MKHGDFTGLAGNYAKYRPGYAPGVTTAILGVLGRDPGEVDAVDIGAGTSIWTCTSGGAWLAIAHRRRTQRRYASTRRADIAGLRYCVAQGRAEATGLKDRSVDLATMASSFHWADFDKACDEFRRILRPGGLFVALWNPRLVETNPLLVEIEAEANRLKPDIRRVSSGRSGLTERLTEMLWAKPHFADVLYVEGRHVARQTQEQYLGAWRSVNDLQVQLGPELFEKFLVYVAKKIAESARRSRRPI